MRTLFTLILLSSISASAATPTPAEGKAFVAKLNDRLKELSVRFATADWIKNTYITDDTERNASTLNDDLLAYAAQAIHDSTRFKDTKLDPDDARMLYLLRSTTALLNYQAPSDPQKRAELSAIDSKLQGMYGKGKWCGKDGKGKCRDLEELSEVMRKSFKYDELLDAWVGWHTISVPMKPLYERLVTLANEGAREVGFADTGEFWRSGYDMSPDEFAKETDRLWTQLEPFYKELHCYVRAKLAEHYGKDKVPLDKPIPAHLLGNMWAQEWQNVYPLVEPYKGQVDLDVTAALKKQKYDAIKTVKLGEAFYTSLGFDPLPKTFWERSMFTKPRDREVVCHASAWDVQFNDDLRIKMCIKPNEEDVITVHHELGHDYYFHAYYQKPILFQAGANDGFHEAIGDSLTLSITPAYLKQLGLVNEVPKNDKALINVQLKRALEKIAFIPWGLLVDRWRWDVFSGKVSPNQYEDAWWALRRKYQGVDSPVARTEADFDPGAKYHVAASVPYTRYFLALVLQYQFHRAMCRIAGFKGPLHECSIYGNKEVGKRLWAMLSLGASKPWPDALEALTGERQMDASAITDYYAPLMTWLKEQNKGRSCGW